MNAKLEVSKVREIIPTADGSGIVVKVEGVVGQGRTELEIAITSDLAAAVAISLLATTAQARADRDGLQPALEVLAAAVVESGSAEKVRMHLLFDKGSVLPVEIPTDAAHALQKDLIEQLGPAEPAIAFTGR